MTQDVLQQTIIDAFENRDQYSPGNTPAEIRSAIDTALAMLDNGEARVAEPLSDNNWQVNEWLKKAVLLSFRVQPNAVMQGSVSNYYDKVPLKYAGAEEQRFANDGVRVVPQATVRYGAYVAPDVVLMPCFVNIGAWIGSGTLVDTWATVGSCAQIGSNVHLSGGAGIGGVLEPVQASPTVIGDNCFVGARSEIVEGVVVENDAVISMGVFVGQSTRIYDREKDNISYGRIPSGAVVVPGTLPSDDGKYALNCAVIVKRVDAKTRARVGINELLRNAR